MMKQMFVTTEEERITQAVLVHVLILIVGIALGSESLESFIQIFTYK